MGELTGRPRLLFLCQTTPFPPDGGVWVRTYHVLRLLCQVFEVTALCFERAGSAAARWDVEASRRALGRLADIEIFAIPQRHSRLRYAWDHVRSAARGRVYTTYLYESRAFRGRLTELQRTRAFDLVHVDSLDLAAYLPACDGPPVVCVHHDVESALLRRRAAFEGRAWRRAYLSYQARLMDRVERHWCERIALNVTVSERDAELLKRNVPTARFAVVPNGVDTEEFQPAPAAGTGVAFVGGTNPFPNLDALEFFCAQILPLLRRGRADLPVRWIGRASVQQQREYRQQHGVELTGYAEDVKPLMRDAGCHIVPLRVGGGTRLKILHSWAMGKAVVSTSLGCEGLAAADGINILIRDDPAEFADAVRSVLGDERLRQALGEAGRATAQRLYSWDVVRGQMIDAYRAVMNAPSGRLAGDAGPIRAEAGYGYS